MDKKKTLLDCVLTAWVGIMSLFWIYRRKSRPLLTSEPANLASYLILLAFITLANLEETRVTVAPSSSSSLACCLESPVYRYYMGSFEKYGNCLSIPGVDVSQGVGILSWSWWGTVICPQTRSSFGETHPS